MVLKSFIRLSMTAAAFVFVGASFAQDRVDGQNDINSVVFATPSKNIFCTYDSDEESFACERTLPNYVGVGLGSGSPEKFMDRRFIKEDFEATVTGKFVLGYGKTWKAGGTTQGLRCSSAKTGLTCKDNSGGFSLSKKGLKLF